MLKNIRNNSDLIRLEEQAPAADASETEDPNNGGTSEYDQQRWANYQACQTEKQQAADNRESLKKAWDDAKKMVEDYETAIAEFTEKQNLLGGEDGKGGIMKGYTDFQNHLNDAWKGKAALNGYADIFEDGGDLTCLANFNTAISSLLSTLEKNKGEWILKRDDAQKAYEDNELIANKTCTY
jgi:hypothetical protein